MLPRGCSLCSTELFSAAMFSTSILSLERFEAMFAVLVGDFVKEM